MIEIPHRKEVLKKIKSMGGLIAAVFPIHYPREIFRSFGIFPVEVWGPPNIDESFSAMHIQQYICSIVRNGLSFIKKGGLDVADIIVVPHCCDSLQGLASILIDFIKPKKPILTLYIPRGDRENATCFFSEEIKSLFYKLKDFTGIFPSQEKIMSCIAVEEEADKKLLELLQKRVFLPVSDFEFYRVVRSREYLPAENFIELCEKVSQKTTEKEIEGKRVLISGYVGEPMKLFDVINKAGGVVVADDFCSSGRRLYGSSKNNNPFFRMAERILTSPPDFAKGSSLAERLNYLLEKIKRFKIQGVIFWTIKFCEPELFYIPLIRDELKKQGVLSIILEIDLNEPLSGQNIERMESFFEVL